MLSGGGAPRSRGARLSSANLYLMGPVTGEQAFQIVADRRAARRADDEQKAERRAAKAQKQSQQLENARNLAASVTLETTGDLMQLTVPELKAIAYTRAPTEVNARRQQLTAKRDWQELW